MPFPDARRALYARAGTQGRTLVAAFVGMIVSVLQLYALGPFLQPIESDLGWSRAEISSGLTVFTIVFALLNPLVGAALDRFGPRRVAQMGVPFYVLVFSTLPLSAGSIWTWWMAWGVLGFVSCLTGAAVWTRAVAVVFSKNRGFAVAVALCGLSASAFLIPLTANVLINAFGWRQALLVLGLTIGGLCFLTSFLLPGHQAGGDPGRGGDPATARIRAPISGAYVRLALAATTFSLISTAFITSAMPMLTSDGLSRDTAAGIAASMGFTGIIGRLGSGFLVDRIEPRFVAATAMSLPIITAVLLIALPGSVPGAVAALLAFGLALGAEFDTVAVIISRLFELRYFGRLFATVVSGTAVAGAVAPLGASLTYDITGSYNAVLAAVIPLSVIAATLVLSIGRGAARRVGHDPTVPEPKGEAL